MPESLNSDGMNGMYAYCVLKRRRQQHSLMGCHIPQYTPQHTDPLWLSDFGASAACFSNASSPTSARQSRKHVCTVHVDRDEEEVLQFLL